MGYDLHIHRAEEWLEAETNPITLDEWYAWVESRPEFELDTESHVGYEGGVTVHPAVWTGHSSGEPVPFWWGPDGEIVLKGVDEEIIRKMVQVADALGARVQGDDGEFYGGDGLPLPEPDDEPMSRGGLFGRLFGRR